MRFIFLLLSLCFAFHFGFGQRVCLTDTREVKSLSLTPELGLRDTLSDEVIMIPVVVHVLYNNSAQNISDAQVMSQLIVLNEDFRMQNSDAASVPDYFKSFAADTRIQFCLAKVDPQGRPTSGIVRRYTSREFFLGDDGMKYTAAGGDDTWDNRRYLNIWVCNLFGRSLGYSTLPGSQPDRDGVVINWDAFGTIGTARAPFNKGRTTTHEVAHWMGLKHIWGDQTCGSDDVDDTPQQETFNFNCPSFPHVSSCSPNTYGDMFMNFMDLTNDDCMKMFTQGQKAKMRSVFAINGARNNFLQSFACDSTNSTAGPIPDGGPLPEPEPEVTLSLKVYPNPFVQTLKIEATNDVNPAGKTVVILDIYGRIMYKSILAHPVTIIQPSNLQRGIYVLRVGEGKSALTFKIVKQ